MFLLIKALTILRYTRNTGCLWGGALSGCGFGFKGDSLILRIDIYAYIYTENFWKDIKEITEIILGDYWEDW